MRELHESMAEDYYIEMDGVQGDRKLIELADGAVAGKGDGRVSGIDR